MREFLGALLASFSYVCVGEKDNHNKNAEQKAKGKKVVITALKVLRDTKLCFFPAYLAQKQ